MYTLGLISMQAQGIRKCLPHHILPDKPPTRLYLNHSENENQENYFQKEGLAPKKGVS